MAPKTKAGAGPREVELLLGGGVTWVARKSWTWRAPGPDGALRFDAILVKKQLGRED